MAIARLVRYSLRYSLNQQQQLSCVNRLFCTGNVEAFGTLGSEISARGRKCKLFEIKYKFTVFITNFDIISVFSSAGNDIRLIGRVRNDVISLPNGFDSFLMRTATNRLGKLIG